MNYEFNQTDKGQIVTLDNMERIIREALLDIQHAVVILTRDLTSGTNQADVDRRVDNGWPAERAIRERFDSLYSAADALNVIRNAAADAEKLVDVMRDTYRTQRREAGQTDIYKAGPGC